MSTNNRYGIRISKTQIDADTPLTEANKKDFITIGDAESHKVLIKTFVTTGTYTHNLNALPVFFCFLVDSAVSPTTFEMSKLATATNTQITNIPNPSYLIICNETVSI